MKVSEVLNELSQTGNTVSKVAKEKVGIAEKRLKQALHNAGYEYRNKGQRGWFYTGEGEQPLDKSINEFVSSPILNRKMKQVTQGNSSNVNIGEKYGEIKLSNHSQQSDIDIHTDFTQNEILALKEMAQAFLTEKEHETKRDILHKRIMSLKKSEKVRKTIVISNEVGAKLDKFAEEKRFNKSDLLEIAILDLINRYE